MMGKEPYDSLLSVAYSHDSLTCGLTHHPLNEVDQE